MLPNDLIAPTPPMGWNSWDCYAATVTEAQLLANAAYMQQHLAPYGWEYIVCDIQWAEPYAGTGTGEYRPMAPLCFDGFGRLLPAENRFPSAAGGKGFAPIAGKIHAMGLKFGIHIMRGIPREAAYARLPVKGTNTTTDQICDPFSTCKWNSDMYGVDHRRNGAQEYYNSLFELYAAWGVDYVKVDDICNTKNQDPYDARKEIEMIRNAIDGCGRPMVLSLSPGPAPIEESWHLKQNANLWRITDDFWDSWPALLDMFKRCEVWQAHVGPGNWPDCDMLPLGHIGMGFKRPRQTNFTKEEQITMMTLWCIFRAPLMMGGEMNDNDAFTLSLLTNKAVLRMHREGAGANQVERSDTHAIWQSFAPDGSTYLALFNLADGPQALTAALAHLAPGKTKAQDLWAGRPVNITNGTLTETVPPHGALLLRLV